MYYVFIGKMLLPIAPESIEVATGSNNEFYSLINEGETTVIKSRPLQEISFEFILPRYQYGYAHYTSGFIGASVFIEYLKTLKEDKEPTQLIISRDTGDFTNLTITLEDYSVSESSEYAGDYRVSVTLKEYKAPEQWVLKVLGTVVGALTSNRSTTYSPKPKKTNKTYTVKKGDTLWAIAKKYYNDGTKYKVIAEANQITNQDLIYPNQKLTIPVVNE